MPHDIELNKDTMKVTIQTTDGSQRNITPQVTDNVILLPDFFNVALTEPTQVRFKFDTGFKNADSTNRINPIVIRTRDSVGSIIDQGDSNSITFTANKIKDIIVDPEQISCDTGNPISTTESICTFKLEFEIGAEYPIEPGSRIEIELPLDLEIPDPSVTVAT